jgi:WD40 repeat protein
VDAQKGKPLWSARLPAGEITFLAVSPDGKRLAWSADDAVRLCELKTGRELRRFVGHEQPVGVGAFSPGGEWLVTASESDVRLWDTGTAKELRHLDGHGGYPVKAIAFAPDGKTLGTVGGDAFVSLWSTSTWRRKRRIAVPEGWGAYLAFSAGGKTVAAGQDERTVSLWDTGTGKLRHRLAGHRGQILAVAFARDGKTVVSAGADSTALVWKWPAAQLAPERPRPIRKDVLGNPLPAGALARMGALWLRQRAPVAAAAFSPDGKTLAVASTDNQDRAIYLWDLETGKERRPFPAEALWFRNLAFSPDGKRLAATATDKAIYLWDTATGKRVGQILGHPGSVYSFAFSPDGKTLAAGGGGDRDSPDQDIRLFDVASGRERLRLAAHRTPIGTVAFAADGRTLLSFSPDMVNDRGPSVKGNVCVWSATTGKLLRRLQAPGSATGSAIEFAPDGRSFVRHAGDSELVRVDLASGRALARMKAGKNASWLFSPDGKLLVICDEEALARIIDVRSGQEVRRIGQRREDHRSVLCFSPDSKRLATATSDSAVRLWDIGTGKEIQRAEGHRGSITCLAFAPDKSTLASGGADNTVRLWDAKTGRQLRTLGKHSHALTTLAFAPDGRTLAAGDDGGTVRLCDPATGKETARSGVRGGIRSVSFTPNGKTVLVVGSNGTLLVWDARTGKVRPREQTQHDRGAVHAVSADGAVVVSAPRPDLQRIDNPAVALLFWNRLTCRLLAKTKENISGSDLRIVFAPDGRTAAVSWTKYQLRGGSVSYLVLVEVATGRQILGLDETSALLLRSMEGRCWDESVGPLAFSPNGRLLAAGKVLWDLATGKQAGQVKGHRGAVTELAFSPDGAALATGSTDGTILVWDLAGFRIPSRPRGDPAVPAALWADLADADAGRAHASAWRLVLDPARAVPLLRKRLRPVPAPDAKRLHRLIAELDSDTFAVRRQARRELEQLGELAESALRAALQKKPSAEVRRQAKALLAKLDARITSPANLQALRAVAVLERIGSPEARAVLADLARGAADAWLTLQAKASLRRLAR